jgi:hypothetical protein
VQSVCFDVVAPCTSRNLLFTSFTSFSYYVEESSTHTWVVK